MDKQLQFSSAQAVTATAVSTNVVDIGAAAPRIGDGENLNILVECDVAMTDAGSDSTVTAELVTDDNESMSSATLLQTLGVFPALSAIGAAVKARIAQGLAFERYIAVRYTVANGDLTTGSFSAHIVKDLDVQKAYPDAITIAN